MKYTLNEPTVVGFLERLQASGRLRGLCGLAEEVPSESTCSRFFAVLTARRVSVDELTAAMVNEIKQYLPSLGEIVAVDGTDIESWSNPERTVKSDPSASWGVRTRKVKIPLAEDADNANAANAAGDAGDAGDAEDADKKGKKRKRIKKVTEFYWGYRMHCLADARYGIPLAFIVLPANKSESTQLPELVAKAQRMYGWFAPKFFVADRGYDGLPNHQFLVSQGITPIIHIKKSTSKDGLHDGIYSTMGVPTCDGRTAMEYVLTDPESGRHLYRCPAKGCRLKRRSSGAVRYCDTTDHWEDPRDNLRVISVVARKSRQWKELYRLRPSIERYFSSGKRSRLLHGSMYLTMDKVAVNTALSVLLYVATVLAKLQAGDRDGMRHMRIRV